MWVQRVKRGLEKPQPLQPDPDPKVIGRDKDLTLLVHSLGTHKNLIVYLSVLPDPSKPSAKALQLQALLKQHVDTVQCSLCLFSFMRWNLIIQILGYFLLSYVRALLLVGGSNRRSGLKPGVSLYQLGQ